jgi:acyl-CoA synthetase (NDP forming)
MSALTSMLRPGAVAVIGASASRVSQGNVVLANLRRAGYSGAVTVVHPSAEVVDGVKTVPSIENLPEGIDVAVACVPAHSLADTIRRLADVGCPSVITVAAGFTEEEDSELRALVKALDIAVAGPNGMGMINLSDGIPLYTARYRDSLPVGKAAVIAQSGSAAIALANYPGIGFSKIITSGNEYGVTAADYVEWLAGDPDTTVVGLVTESVRDPRHFERAARRLVDAGKSLVVLKVGRSELGAQATKAHTRAIVGANETYSAYFRRIGVPTVRDYDELGAALQCLSVPSRPVRGPRIGVISISGGQGALACDVASEEGMSLAELSPETSETIKALLPGSSGLNPLDLGASVGSKDRRFDALQAFVADEQVDLVAVLQDAQATLPIHPQHDYIPHIRQVVELGTTSDKPVVLISSTAANTHAALESIVEGSPVPLLRGMRSGFAGLRALIERRLSVAEDEADDLAGCPQGAEVEELRAQVGNQSGVLSRSLTLRLLDAYGIPVARSAQVDDEDSAIAAALELGYPLVVKVVSADIPHKSDVGGVVTGVSDEPALRVALRNIRSAVGERAPAARITGFELQEYLEGGLEAVVGFTTDAALGSLVVVGTGGLLVEISDDHQSGLAPISARNAGLMISRTRIGRLLSGYRNLWPTTDLAQLEQVVRRVGRLADDMSGLVVEGDLNPVMVTVGSGRSVAVDALLVAPPGN